ncbi:MAG: 16S rRNA (cytosine(967)-C(5))-methyltransferase RsmB [Verrucomicrobium sp.]|nr:16S rRNA (cytosine(967)-C(5))-methyltransferase RsmB [Verrucomicrobium sp.]
MTSNSSEPPRRPRAVPPPSARSLALDILLQRESPGDFLEHRIDGLAGMHALSEADRRLAREIAFGVLRNRSVLDHLVALRTDGRPQRPVLRGVLQSGLYQLLFLDRVPDHAVVNEAVLLARQRGFSAQAGFVNAVLRGVARDREACRRDLEAFRRSDPALGWSHPAWLVERWAGVLDPVAVQRLLAWNNAAPATFARVNRLLTTPQDLMARWRSEGVEATPVAVDWAAPGTLVVLDGGFYVQDPSTLMAVHLLDPRPGQRVLDLCAAPGGKALAMAERLRPGGGVVAHDSHPGRLDLIRENVRRLGAGALVAVVDRLGDPAVGALDGPSGPASERFDAVLVDAPCSNTGVLRRRVELRWRLRPDEIPRLAAEQLRLLEAAAARVRPGGVLVYSTCSLEPEENDQVVEAFLRRHPGWAETARRRLHPAVDAVDGAFAARLVAPAHGPSPHPIPQPNPNPA